MLWAPTLMPLVLQIAVLLLAAPAGNATALQPLIATPPSVNATLPVGAAPATVAVNVTAAPSVEGFRLLEITVVVGCAAAVTVM